ncbi:MAG: ABC transporter ATP-binding protein [Methanosarcina sp.]|nr:ABC transporter ATP-binding protein [Methanosarcina sp.]
MLDVKNLTVSFRTGPSMDKNRKQSFRAVDRVSFSLRKGEAMGLVGKSGSGKTSLGLAVLQLIRPTSGSVRFCGTELTALDGRALREIRPRIQPLFQDPTSSLNPCMRLGASLEEALRLKAPLSKEEARTEALKLMELVELEPGLYSRYPFQLSGGQNQRAALARALALEPDLLVADEPTSALDVSVQAQVLGLLQKLRQERGLTLLFISHDLEVVKKMCDRVAVMHAGKLVELGKTEEVFKNPIHSCTKSLLFPNLEVGPGDARRRPPVTVFPAKRNFTRVATGIPDEKGFSGLVAGAVARGKFNSLFSGNGADISGFSLLSFLKEKFKPCKKRMQPEPGWENENRNEEMVEISRGHWVLCPSGFSFSD